MKKKIIIKALEAYREKLKLCPPGHTDYGNSYWEIKRVEEALEELNQRVDSHTLLTRLGGSWLGVARTWMQSKFRNGENVHWGTDDVLEGRQVTVRDIEHLASVVAASAINSERGLT